MPFFEAEAKKRQGERRDLNDNISQKIDQCKNTSKASQQAANQFDTNRQYVSDLKKINRNRFKICYEKGWTVSERVAILAAIDKNSHGGNRKNQVDNCPLDRNEAAKRVGFNNEKSAYRATKAVTHGIPASGRKNGRRGGVYLRALCAQLSDSITAGDL